MSFEINIGKTRRTRVSEVNFNSIPFGKIFSDHMFIADFRMGEWENCRIVPFGKFLFHPATSSLHYGQSIFEGMKAYAGKNGEALIFRPDKNLARMNQSARRMAMPELPEELFFSALNELVSLDRQWIPKVDGGSLYIRPFMFATDEYVGIKPSDNFTFMIFTCPVGAYYEHPVKVLIDDRYVRAFPGGVGTAKAAGNYGATLFPVKQARANSYDQLLWLDGIEKKYIQEIGTMNVFFQIGEKVVTPTLDEGTILDGITRDSVIRLLKRRGIEVEERRVSVDEIVQAFDNQLLLDAFGTGTAATVSPIAEIGYNGKKMHLPPVSTRQISVSIKQELQDIKHLKKADDFGWVHSVESSKVEVED